MNIKTKKDILLNLEILSCTSSLVKAYSISFNKILSFVSVNKIILFILLFVLPLFVPFVIIFSLWRLSWLSFFFKNSWIFLSTS